METQTQHDSIIKMSWVKHLLCEIHISSLADAMGGLCMSPCMTALWYVTVGENGDGCHIFYFHLNPAKTESLIYSLSVCNGSLKCQVGIK